MGLSRIEIEPHETYGKWDIEIMIEFEFGKYYRNIILKIPSAAYLMNKTI